MKLVDHYPIVVTAPDRLAAIRDEVDRWDPALGSSPDALVLATSTGHSDFYVQVVEDIPTTHLRISGTTSRDVRADMVLVEQPAGGAVFSASAISFLGSLSHNGYDNNVSQLLGNVLGEFMRRPGKRSARERVHEIAPS